MAHENHLKITNISQHIKKSSPKCKDLHNFYNMQNLKEPSGRASCGFIYTRTGYVQFDPLQASTGCMSNSRQQASSVELEYSLWRIGGLSRMSMWNEGCVPGVIHLYGIIASSGLPRFSKQDFTTYHSERHEQCIQCIVYQYIMYM